MTLYTGAPEVNTVSFLPNEMVSKHCPENSISLSFLQEASAVMRDSKSEKKVSFSRKTWRFGEFWINLTGKDEGFSEIREGYKFLSKLACQPISQPHQLNRQWHSDLVLRPRWACAQLLQLTGEQMTWASSWPSLDQFSPLHISPAVSAPWCLCVCTLPWHSRNSEQRNEKERTTLKHNLKNM